MLRIHFLQQFFDLSDPAAKDALHDSISMARFARIVPDVTGVSDESTILRLSHLLEKHGFGQAIFETVNAHLSERGLIVRPGTIVGATLIAVPPSTKNRAKGRDPQMRQTRRGAPVVLRDEAARRHRPERDPAHGHRDRPRECAAFDPSAGPVGRAG